MATKEFKECLIDVYRGEILGEMAFESMLPAAETDEQRYIIATMLQFETEGKAIVRPLIMRFGLPIVEEADDGPVDCDPGAQMNSLPWVDRFTAMRDLVQANFLPRYEELATLISADEDAEAARIASFMGDHERALVELANNIIAGHPDPAAPVANLLHFPLPRPG